MKSNRQTDPEKNMWRKIFDLTPLPMLIVDGDVRIEACNTAARDMVGKSRTKILRKRGGEALHCIHALESPNGCGHGPFCKTCVIRNSVIAAIRGRSTRWAQAHLELLNHGKLAKLHLLVTAVPFELEEKELVLLILENPARLPAAQDFSPHRARSQKGGRE
jgi:PAS domain-containing protein